ncbi:MAG: hypothetical protein HZR80_19095 [Candidatus Heimdallarchaeota archaeon]
MKVWIVHDSQFGNGEKLAKTLGKILEKDMDVEISHNKNITPAKVVADSPDVIIVGSAVRAFMSSGASKKWIKKLHKELMKANKSIKCGATFLTHAMPFNMIEGKGHRLNKLLANNPAIDKVYSQFLSGQVIGQEGPFKDEVIPEIEKQAAEILKWIKQ